LAVAKGVLVDLHRWPVKSLGGERLRAARLDRRGLGGDRTHALLDRRHGHQGRRLTARQAPRLLAWTAAYPTTPDDQLDPADPPPPTLWAPDHTGWAWDDPALAAALAADLGLAVRPHRDLAGQQDLPASVLVTTEASRRAVEVALGRPVALGRFRPNLHLALDAPAFAEERWQGGRLRVGEVSLALLHPCGRCVIPTWDPDGLGRWPGLLRWLVRERGGCSGSTPGCWWPAGSGSATRWWSPSRRRRSCRGPRPTAPSTCRRSGRWRESAIWLADRCVEPSERDAAPVSHCGC
jgi:uncharacterized protein